MHLILKFCSKKQITGITQLVGEGVTFELAAKIIGVTEEEELALYRQADSGRDTGGAQEGAQDDEIARILEGTEVEA